MAHTATTVAFPTQQQVEDIVNEYLDGAPGVGVAVGVAAPDASPSTSALYYVGGGMATPGGHPVPLGASTPFWIASVTKTFTATLFSSYARASNAVWTGTAGGYQPAGTDPLYSDYAALTLRSAATYTSGLPADNVTATDQPYPLPYPYTRSEMYGFLNTDRFPLGSGYAYSNLGFALVGNAMPQAAGEPQAGYADLLTQVVLDPLGMTASTFYGASSELGPIAQGYWQGQASGAQWAQWPAYNPGGGLISTPTDMMTWMQYNMGMLQTPLNDLLGWTQVPQTPIRTSWGNQLGLGWFIGTIPVGDGNVNVIWKDGALPTGYGSYINFVQSSAPGSTPSQAGVFVLANLESLNAYAIAAAVLALVLDPTSAPIPRAEAEQRFRHVAHQDL